MSTMDAFNIGRQVGKSKRSTFGMTSDTLLDQFNKGAESNRELGKLLAVEQFKNSMTSPKDEANIAESNAKANYYNSRSNVKPALSVSQQNIKDKRTENLFSQYEDTELKKKRIDSAKKSLSRIPGGLMGKASSIFMKNFDPNNPVMTDWQNVKSILTDAQLQRVAKTKGAISDREMELFSQAAANDDLPSVARMGHVLDAMRTAAEVSMRAPLASYQQIYGEDPMEFLNPLQKSLARKENRADSYQDASLNGGIDIEAEKASAIQAINKGASAKKVAERFKTHTGMDLDLG